VHYIDKSSYLGNTLREMNSVQYIDRDECIGDSLNKINLNFSNLDFNFAVLSSTSHTWAIQNSANINTSMNWVSSNKNYITDASTWVHQNTAYNLDILTWMQYTSAAAKATTNWYIETSAFEFNIQTWVKEKSGLLDYVLATQCLEQTPLYSIKPVYKFDTTIHNGQLNILESEYSSLLGGYNNTLDGDYSILVGGINNHVIGNENAVVCGNSNTVQGSACVVVCGTYNLLSGVNSFIGSGTNNEANGGSSVIVGGSRNTIDGNFSGIVGGLNNKIVHNNSFIVGSNITSNAPNTAFVNNLNIASSPAADNTSSELLVRGKNGAINARIVRNLQFIDPMFSWVSQNSGFLNNVEAWVYDNSASFATTALITALSSKIETDIQSSENRITTGDVFTWSRNTSAQISTVNNWYNTSAASINAATLWVTERESQLQSVINTYYTKPPVTKIVKHIDVITPLQTFSIMHNLGTRDVIVQCYDSSTYDTVELSVIRNSENEILIDVGNVNSGAYQVVIMG